MSQRIQILKANEVRKGVAKASGKPYEMQDVEAIIINADGSVAEVGKLMLPKDLTGDKAPGVGLYDVTFTLGTDREGRIEARVAALVPARAQTSTAKAA